MTDHIYEQEMEEFIKQVFEENFERLRLESGHSISPRWRGDAGPFRTGRLRRGGRPALLARSTIPPFTTRSTARAGANDCRSV